MQVLEQPYYLSQCIFTGIGIIHFSESSVAILSEMGYVVIGLHMLPTRVLVSMETITPHALPNEERDGDVQCRQCGACCHVDMLAYVTPEDIERWEQEGRRDIIDHLSNRDVFWAGDQVYSKFGTKVSTCHYLDWNGSTFFCQIHETRPMVCRSYNPGSSELCPLYHRVCTACADNFQ